MNLESPEFASMKPKEDPIVPVLNMFPGINPSFLESASQTADSVILATFVNGGVPSVVCDFIEKKTKEGIPVFLVPDKLNEPYTLKTGNEFGITDVPDQTLADAIHAGAILIEKVNLAELSTIQNLIREKFQEGLRGIELGKAVHDHFGFSEDEERPKAEWEKS